MTVLKDLKNKPVKTNFNKGKEMSQGVKTYTLIFNCCVIDLLTIDKIFNLRVSANLHL